MRWKYQAAWGIEVDHEGHLLDVDTAGERSVVMSTREDPERNFHDVSRVFWSMSPCVAETVKSLARILSVSQSTLRRVLAKMTDCVMAASRTGRTAVELPLLLVDVDVNCLIPSRVSSSRFTMRTGFVMNTRDLQRLRGIVAEDTHLQLRREELEDVVDLVPNPRESICPPHRGRS